MAERDRSHGLHAITNTVTELHGPEQTGMKSSRELYFQLDEAIDRARRRLLENASMPTSSKAEANVLLGLAEEAVKNMSFDRAYHHYEKAISLIWSRS
jgi:hypothetical protein